MSIPNKVVSVIRSIPSTMFPLNYKSIRLIYFEKTGGAGWTDGWTDRRYATSNVALR